MGKCPEDDPFVVLAPAGEGKCPEDDPFVVLAPAGEGQKIASKPSHLNRARRQGIIIMCLACLNTGRTENATYHIAEQ